MEYIIKSNSYRLLKEYINNLTKDIDSENINYFDLSIDDINTIINEANYTSLFNDKKAIIVYNSNIFGTKYEYKEDLEILEKYLNNPNKNSLIIFITDSINLKKKCVKIVKNNNNLIELNMPKDEELRKKVKEYLSVSNFKIENKALELLINNNLNNYDYILNELDKVLVIKKDYLINVDDINKYTTKNDNFDLFKYVDLIVTKNITKSLKELENALKSVEPAVIFSTLATQYRLIYCVKNLNNYSESDIAKLLNIHPYRVKLAKEKSYNYETKELEHLLLSIGEYDLKIKKGLLDKNNALKTFILNI